VEGKQGTWDWLSVIGASVAILMVFGLAPTGAAGQLSGQPEAQGAKVFKLCDPRQDGTFAVEKALQQRRSVRVYKDEGLNLDELAQMLWAAQGITDTSKGLRTAPSARAQYFVTVYVLAGKVAGLPQGLYRYVPKDHALVRVMEGDVKGELFKAVGQAPIKNAPVAIVLTGASDRATNPRWMALEAGHVSQNMYLQAVPLGLGTVAVAGFTDEKVRGALKLSEKEQPLYIMPIGRK
jgi:SagB-type dehydrogenase family enzyme